MVASFIIFVRGVEEVGNEQDWLNLQRLFISSRRDGGGEHWVRTRPVCYTLSGAPPTPPVDLSTPPAPRGFYVFINFKTSPQTYYKFILENSRYFHKFIINHRRDRKQICVGKRTICLSAKGEKLHLFLELMILICREAADRLKVSNNICSFITFSFMLVEKINLNNAV